MGLYHSAVPTDDDSERIRHGTRSVKSAIPVFETHDGASLVMAIAGRSQWVLISVPVRVVIAFLEMYSLFNFTRSNFPLYLIRIQSRQQMRSMIFPSASSSAADCCSFPCSQPRFGGAVYYCYYIQHDVAEIRPRVSIDSERRLARLNEPSTRLKRARIHNDRENFEVKRVEK